MRAAGRCGIRWCSASEGTILIHFYLALPKRILILSLGMPQTFEAVRSNSLETLGKSNNEVGIKRNLNGTYLVLLVTTLFVNLYVLYDYFILSQLRDPRFPA